MPVKMLFHPTLKITCLLSISFGLIFGFMSSAEAEYQWPDQTIKATQEAIPTAPPAVQKAITDTKPPPAVKLTLEGCLEQVRSTQGHADPSSDAVRNCYKQWAGTANSTIQSFGIIRSIVGPGPCYVRQTVTLSDGGTMQMKTGPNEIATNCNRVIKDQEVTYPLSAVNVEYFRSLLGMKILNTFQSAYSDPQMVEPTGTKWTFILNGQPAKIIDVNVLTNNSLPAELQAYLNSFNSIIVQTQNQ